MNALGENDAVPELSLAAREALYAAGHNLFSQERVGEAAAVFRILLQLAPTDERGWLALGACHEQIEQPDVAQELYAAGISAAPNAARCALASARLLQRDGREDEAAEALALSRAFAESGDDDELLALIDAERLNAR